MRLLSLLLLWIAAVTPSLVAEDLPKVLIIVDEVHLGPARTAADELKGRAEVTVPAGDSGDTGAAIGKLDELLGQTKWDLIYFNFGFADLRHLDPKTKSVRLMSRHAGGERVTGPQAYRENLRKIVSRLKATKAQLIWASTTPLVGTKYDGIYESGSEKEYNAIAATIMKEENVEINDRHAWVLENVKNFRDSFSFRRIPIHEPVVESIETALKLPKKVKTQKKD